MIKESLYCSKVTERELNKRLVMTEKYRKNHEDFNISTKFWICKKARKEGEVKVKDHNHLTGKYRGSVHQVCNFNLSLSKIPVEFYNLQNYDSHLIVHEIGK